MNKHVNIIIAGAGGIAEAVGLILAEQSKVPPTLFIGNRTLSKAQEVVQWIERGTSKPTTVKAFELHPNALSEEANAIFRQGDILLDCLPGGLAPQMARYAKIHHLHYANLTEYVDETNQIRALAKDARTGFILQTGLAPGYINVLAHKMFRDFCDDFNVDIADYLGFKVGALTLHAVSPHFYGFTWSPIGVATEYVKDAIAIRAFQKTALPSLSQRTQLLINGVLYEDDLTSGGAADLPDALAGRVRTLDYKTLRHPGHYGWVSDQLKSIPGEEDPIPALQRAMEEAIPHVEDDQVVLYAAVEGKDASGVLRRREVAKQILPLLVGKHKLRAIQATTAAPLIQAAQLLWESDLKGVVLQSQINPDTFLNGDFVKSVYGGV
ncbi:saccharopine dehydrogenase family protein [Robiginitalea marina]|uniref:Saccharopine dehydrogenase NADP-binding domain-containing protein n=1 Tax=Robiginitalea marina TaxID=2954105 RepID=A0ABT1AW62_9FLAO|nr:saccharopine dehydrogenase C-terminal domain-containing protein [Robiginitalea marina]MCO5724121.1 saccharopine dehydrogenase NADP-binding domain-containing protein [Robiginitalea marina]